MSPVAFICLIASGPPVGVALALVTFRFVCPKHLKRHRWVKPASGMRFCEGCKADYRAFANDEWFAKHWRAL